MAMAEGTGGGLIGKIDKIDFSPSDFLTKLRRRPRRRRRVQTPSQSVINRRHLAARQSVGLGCLKR